MGYLWAKQERYQEAAHIYYVAIEMGRKTLGNSPLLSNYLNNFASTLMHLGKLSEAEKYLMESIEIDKLNNFSDSNSIKHSENLKFLHNLQQS